MGKRMYFSPQGAMIPDTEHEAEFDAFIELVNDFDREFALHEAYNRIETLNFMMDRGFKEHQIKQRGQYRVEDITSHKTLKLDGPDTLSDTELDALKAALPALRKLIDARSSRNAAIGCHRRNTSKYWKSKTRQLNDEEKEELVKKKFVAVMTRFYRNYGKPYDPHELLKPVEHSHGRLVSSVPSSAAHSPDLVPFPNSQKHLAEHLNAMEKASERRCLKNRACTSPSRKRRSTKHSCNAISILDADPVQYPSQKHFIETPGVCRTSSSEEEYSDSPADVVMGTPPSTQAPSKESDK